MKMRIFSTSMGSLCAGFILFFFLMAFDVTATVRYVRPVAAGTGDGSSWANASDDLQAMIDASAAGDAVWVAEGTYKPTTGNDRTISFSMKNGVAIYGGFPNSGSPGFGSRNWTAYVTTLSGDIGTPNYNSDNSYHVIANNGLNDTAVLDGFTVTGGNANGSISDNFKNTGGGMYNNFSDPTVTHCIFTGNAGEDGAGMGNRSSSGPVVANCLFYNNTGDGMWNNNALVGTQANLTNCVFYNNSGSGISNLNAAPEVTNCTFYGNSDAGITSFSPFTGVYGSATNCIFWGNQEEISWILTVTYSIVQDGYPGTGNLDVDPIFVNPQGGDLHLQSCSPAINAGTSTGAPATDIEGNSRPANGGFDMGAYEFTGGLSFKITCYQDNDNDGFGNLAQAKDFCVICGTGYVNNSTDCDDNNTNINPFKAEVCDGIDNDCDGFVDTADPNLVDNVPPSVTCKNHMVNLSATGTATISPANVYQSGSDNCGTVNLQSVSLSTFNCANVGNNTVTLTVNDGHGNTNTCTANVNVQDNTPPTVVCKSHTAVINVFGNVTISPANVFLSGSDNCGTVNLQSVVPNTFNCFNLGNNTVTLFVNDGHLNTATCTATVTIQDFIPPSVICKNYTAVLDANGSATIAPANVFQSGMDNCGTVNLQSVSPNTFSCTNLGNNTVTLTVNDGHGNTNTCTATVNVQDNTPPTVGCKNHTVILDANGVGGISSNDVYEFMNSYDNCGTVNLQSVSPNIFNCTNLGNNTVTLTGNDGHGNTNTCTATVTVEDNIQPVVTCKDHIVALNANGSAVVSPVNIYQTGTDNCGTVNLQSISPNAFSCGNVGNNTVTLTVNDGHGNTGTCTANVTVQLDLNTVITYTLLAQEEVHTHKTSVSGNVGVWQTGKDAKIHDYSTVNGFVMAPVIDKDNYAIITGASYLVQAPQPAAGSFKYNTQTDPPSDVNVPDNYPGVYQLTGNLFRKIEVGKNSAVQFMSSGEIFIKEFKTKDSDNGSNSSVRFSGPTELIIRKKLELGKRTEFNWGGAGSVKAYVEEDEVKVKESSKVNASLDVRFQQLTVEDAKETNHTLMTGQFIAKKIDSQKWVDWNWAPFECGQAVPPASNMVVSGDVLGLDATLKGEKVELLWLSNTGYKTGRFEVERSQDGINFEPLTEVVNEYAGHAAKQYRKDDPSPRYGCNFYRVKVRFEDGTWAYTNVSRVDYYIVPGELNLWPNPASREVSIFREEYAGKPGAIILVNSLGQPLMEREFEALPDGPATLSLDNLKEGIYWVTIQVKGFRSVSKRLVIVKDGN